jgi:comEA protein
MKNTMVAKMKTAAALLGLLATLAIAGTSFAAKQAPGAPVDINKASAEELMSVPGLGPAKAQAIVAQRATAPFSTTEELVNVKGIGEKLFAKISPYVTVSGAPQAAKPGTAEKATR